MVCQMIEKRYMPTIKLNRGGETGSSADRAESAETSKNEWFFHIGESPRIFVKYSISMAFFLRRRAAEFHLAAQKLKAEKYV